MADAKICDRCRNFYTRVQHKEYGCLEEYNMTYTAVSVRSRSDNIGYELDLCPVCFSKFNTWINMKEKENDEQ